MTKSMMLTVKISCLRMRIKAETDIEDVKTTTSSVPQSIEFKTPGIQMSQTLFAHCILQLLAYEVLIGMRRILVG